MLQSVHPDRLLRPGGRRGRRVLRGHRCLDLGPWSKAEWGSPRLNKEPGGYTSGPSNSEHRHSAAAARDIPSAPGCGCCPRSATSLAALRPIWWPPPRRTPASVRPPPATGPHHQPRSRSCAPRRPHPAGRVNQPYATDEQYERWHKRTAHAATGSDSSPPSGRKDRSAAPASAAPCASTGAARVRRAPDPPRSPARRRRRDLHQLHRIPPVLRLFTLRPGEPAARGPPLPSLRPVRPSRRAAGRRHRPPINSTSNPPPEAGHRPPSPVAGQVLPRPVRHPTPPPPRRPQAASHRWARGPCASATRVRPERRCSRRRARLPASAWTSGFAEEAFPCCVDIGKSGPAAHSNPFPYEECQPRSVGSASKDEPVTAVSS